MAPPGRFGRPPTAGYCVLSVGPRAPTTYGCADSVGYHLLFTEQPLSEGGIYLPVFVKID